MHRRVGVDMVANLQSRMDRFRYALLTISTVAIHIFRVDEVDGEDSEFVAYRLCSRSVHIDRPLRARVNESPKLLNLSLRYYFDVYCAGSSVVSYLDQCC